MRLVAILLANLRLLMPLLLLASLWGACEQEQPEILDLRDKRRPEDLLNIVDGAQKYQSPNCANLSYDSILSLTANEQQNVLKSDFYKELRGKIPSFVKIIPVEESLSSSRPSTYHIDLKFAVGDVNLCQYHGRFHSTPIQEFIKGDLPTTLPPPINPQTLDWQENINHWLLAVSKMLQAKPSQLAIYRSERCLVVTESTYQAAWELSFYIDQRPFQALIVEDRVAELSPNYFQVDGSAQVYEQKAGTRGLMTVPLTKLQPGGYLCNSHVTTRVPADQQLAMNVDMNFHFPPDDPRFKEVSAFTSVYLMWQWFLSKNPTNWARSPVEVVLTNDPSRIADGPVYENPDIKSSLLRPTIYAPDHLGSAGRYSLSNINTDFDALAHELGHHIIFQYVQLSSNIEHKALLEAWADFFVMAKTGDACLGETICPANSEICAVPNCLRIAENNLSLHSEEYTAMQDNHHLKSQLISGFLWSLHTRQGIPLAQVGDLLFFALPYMARKTNYADFLSSLFKAEMELSDGKHKCKIYKEAMTRGLEGAIPNDVRCTS